MARLNGRLGLSAEVKTEPLLFEFRLVHDPNENAYFVEVASNPMADRAVAEALMRALKALVDGWIHENEKKVHSSTSS